MIEQMKPSGIDWIGDVPSSWKMLKLKYFSYLKGRIGWQGLTADEFIDEGPYLITGTDFENGRIQFDRSYHISEERYEQAPEIQLKIGDLLVTKDGTVGKMAYVDELPDKASLNSHLLLIRPLKNRYDNRFLFWLMSSTVFTGYTDYSQDGTIMASLSQEKIGNFIAYFPTVEEQVKIADYLDAKCSKLDSIIADLEKQIDTLQKYKKSLITETVTKGLDKSAQMKDSGTEWIGEIPAHWKVIRITKYLDSLVDYRGKTPEKVDNGIFLVTARNIKNGVIDYSLSQEYVAVDDYEEIMHRGKPHKGDVLFTTEAPLGEVANVDNTDIALAQRVIKFRGRKNCINNYYLKYWIMSLGFQSFLASLATGSTALGIAASKLGQLKMVLPTYDEQAEIVSKLDAACDNIDAIIVTKKEQLEHIQQYKKSLIYEYVTGKKCVMEVK